MKEENLKEGELAFWRRRAPELKEEITSLKKQLEEEERRSLEYFHRAKEAEAKLAQAKEIAKRANILLERIEANPEVSMPGIVFKAREELEKLEDL